MDKLFKFGAILFLAWSLPLNAHADFGDIQIIISLERYQMTVIANRASKEYKISFGGPEIYANSCLYTHGTYSGFCPPPQCVMSAPPLGLFHVQETRPVYVSGLYNSVYRNVIFFKAGYMIRAMNDHFEMVGHPLFTCGAITLRPKDARELFDLVSSVDPSNVSVLVQ